jgi:peptidoglycan/LPS O-acetylase OafA/YrhL
MTSRDDAEDAALARRRRRSGVAVALGAAALGAWVARWAMHFDPPSSAARADRLVIYAALASAAFGFAAMRALQRVLDRRRAQREIVPAARVVGSGDGVAGAGPG